MQDGTVVNPAAFPRFVRVISPAFRGSAVPAAAGPRPAGDQITPHKADPEVVWPVMVSRFAAPNAQRLGSIVNLPEYRNFRRPISGEIFVAEPSQYTRVVRRRMAATPAMRGLVSSRDNQYRAPMYIGVPPDLPPTPPAPPITRMLGGR